MQLKTPAFWQERGIIAYLLLPFSFVYWLVISLKKRIENPFQSSLPVICIGGVVAGGSGKTPTVHRIAEKIIEDGIYQRPVILTRGYGGILKGPTKVDPSCHTAHDVGDEALLHARIVPTIVAHDRAAGAKLAQAMNADIIVMDDGLQNNSLHKTTSVLIVDSSQKFGNGFMIPAGPLRERLSSALNKCACVVSIGGDITIKGDKPTFRATINVNSAHDLLRPYYAFAGLGTPEKFKRTLEQNGFQLSGFKAFPDHYVYTAQDLKLLETLSNGARLITTEKDFVKIPEEWQDKMDVVSISLEIDRLDNLMKILYIELKTP